MGVGAMIGAVLLGGYIQGRAQQKQYNAMAAQSEANAQIAYNNAQKLKEQAESQAQVNELNEENKRRRLLVQQGQQRASISAAGIQASGSAAAALADNSFNAEQELAIDRYNARQQVDSLYNQSTDYVNQGDIYNKNAQQYRKAGKRAVMNSMLQSTMTLATNLYSPNSVGKQAQSTQWTSYGYSDIASSGFSGGTAATVASGSVLNNGSLVQANTYGSNGWSSYKNYYP